MQVTNQPSRCTLQQVIDLLATCGGLGIHSVLGFIPGAKDPNSNPRPHSSCCTIHSYCNLRSIRHSLRLTSLCCIYLVSIVKCCYPLC